MSEYLIDTNVLFRLFKADTRTTAFVESRISYIDATIYIECIQGGKSNRERNVIEKYLQRFPLLPLTPQTSATAITIIRRYSSSHGLLLPDALIAANAIENDLTLVTFNVDDFKFIDGLKVEMPDI